MLKSILRFISVIMLLILSMPEVSAAKKAGAKGASSLNSETLSGGIIHREGYFLPRGLKIPVELRTPIDTRVNKASDLITVQVMEDVAVGDYVIIPANSFLHGSISKLEGPGRMNKVPKVELDFDTVSVPAREQGQDRQFISIKGSVKEVQMLKSSERVNDSGKTFKQRAKLPGIAGAVGGATTAFYITQSAAPFATFGIAGMLNNIAILGSGFGGFMLATSLLEKDDLRLEPGTKLEVMLDEPTFESFPDKYPLSHELGKSADSASPGEAYDKELAVMEPLSLNN